MSSKGYLFRFSQPCHALLFSETHDFTDEEDDDSTANEEGGGGSDSEPSPGMPLEDSAGTARSRISRSFTPTNSGAKRSVSRQKNLKQKFVAILKKFKISEEEVRLQDDSALEITHGRCLGVESGGRPSFATADGTGDQGPL